MTENENPENDAPNSDDSIQEEQNPYADLDWRNPEPEWKSDDRNRSEREQEQEPAGDE